MDPHISASLASLAQLHRSIHEDRMKREFGVVISMITLSAACFGVRYAKGLTQPVNFTVGVIVWIYFAVLAVAGCVYLRGSGKANRFNQSLAEAAEDDLIEALHPTLLKRIRPAWQDPAQDRLEKRCRHPNELRWRWQAALVVFAAFVSAVALSVPI